MDCAAAVGRSRSLVAWIGGTLLLAVLATGAPPPAWAQAGEIAWIDQFGTSGFEVARGVAVDASGVYVVGSIVGTFPGQASAGGFFDAFVRKYDADGVEQWTRQFGTAGRDRANAVAADASGVYVVGETQGTFPGQASAGGQDAFVRKYDAAGVEQWTRQFGTGFDAARGVAVDASGVYVVGGAVGTLPGQTSAGAQDAFVRKYDPDGVEQWTRQFGTPGFDAAGGVAVDASGVYVVGNTTFLGGFPDAFVRKYDPDGVEQWTRQFGTPGFDAVVGVAVDASAVYVVGFTHGTLPGQTSAGAHDGFVRKYDPAGVEQWTRQFGTPRDDFARGVAADAAGVYVVGETIGTFLGQTSAGAEDAFVRTYDPAGVEQWTRQFGTPGFDAAGGVAVDASAVYVVGQTEGTLPGQVSAGGFDAYAAKLIADTGSVDAPPVPRIDAECGGATAQEGETLTVFAPTDGFVSCTFSATRSVDTDGEIVFYAWGINGLGKSIDVEFSAELSPGEHFVELFVEDDDNLGTLTSLTIVARPLRVSWEMPERLRLFDDDGSPIIFRHPNVLRDGAVYLEPDQELHPDSWPVTLLAINPDEEPPNDCYPDITSYVWVVEREPGAPDVIAPTDCRLDLVFPDEGAFPAELTVSAANGQVLVVPLDVVVKDWLIVSIGDSVASGEGNPDIVGVRLGPDPVWQDPVCHRSAVAGPAQAALLLEQADPRSSVTFSHLACSGATIMDGLLGSQEIEFEDQTFRVAAQLDVANALAGEREIDAVLVTVGANDMAIGRVHSLFVRALGLFGADRSGDLGGGFGKLVLACWIDEPCDEVVASHVVRRLDMLPQRYQRLADCLGEVADAECSITALDGTKQVRDPLGLPAERVFIAEYFDPTRNEDGDICPDGILRVPTRSVSPRELQFAYDVLEVGIAAGGGQSVGLNRHVEATAEEHGWVVVGGIAEAFGTHGYCASEPWVVRLGQSEVWQKDHIGTLHPNPAGQTVYGEFLFESMRNSLLAGR